MATLQLAERVIAAAAAKITAGVNARLDTINVEFADDVTVDYPDVHQYGLSPMRPGPHVIVTDGGSPQNSMISGEGPHSFVYESQLNVLVKDDDSDRDRLGRRLLRLERAVVEALWDDDPKEALTITVAAVTNRPSLKIARFVAGPIFNPEYDASLLSSFRITAFTVTKREN